MLRNFIMEKYFYYLLCFRTALYVKDCTNHFPQFLTLRINLTLKSHIYFFLLYFINIYCSIYSIALLIWFAFLFLFLFFKIHWGHAWAVVIGVDPGWSAKKCLSSRKSALESCPISTDLWSQIKLQRKIEWTWLYDGEMTNFSRFQ